MADSKTSRMMHRRVAGQGAFLMSGFAASQAMSFGRNAMLGHMLAKGDFGVAAILTLLLQLLDNLTDLGVDRLIVQARDGGQSRFIATNHVVLIARGVVIAVMLLVGAAPIAAFFAVPEVASSIAALSLVPLIKGFQHLDARRAQRHLDNRPFLWIEVLPQAVALALTWPVVKAIASFQAVVVLSVAQAMVGMFVSHAVARRRYCVAFDPVIIRRLVEFGWPIWLSAFPLVAVYYGDRIVIGHLIGVEALAGYSAAFMVAMVPGLIAAKVGQSIMLPLFASARGDDALLTRRFAAMTEVTTILAAIYFATAVLLGGTLLQIAFGPNFAGLGGVMAWLAAMWSVRMLQAVPGMALLSMGETRPFLIAGCIRAAALIPAIAVAGLGHGLEAVAAMGFAGEVASLAYVCWRMDAQVCGLSGVFARRAAFLLPSALTAAGALAVTGGPDDMALRGIGLTATLGVIALFAATVMPETRSRLQSAART